MAAVKVFEACVVEHDKDSGVNELTNEDSDHSVVGLNGDRLEMECLDEFHKEHLKGEVDSDNDEGDTHGDQSDRGSISEEF